MKETNPIPLHYVAFDLETTGLNPRENRIIEIGAVKVIDGSITDEFDQLVDPRVQIPYHITRLTGITKEDVSGAQRIEQVLPDFLKFIENLPLVAHNAPFDVGFLERSMADLGMRTPMSNRVYDTFELSKFIVPQMRHHSLSSLLSYFNIRLENAHSAFDDAEGAAYLLYSLIKRWETIDLSTFNLIKTVVTGADWPFNDLLKLSLERSKKYALSRKIGAKTYNKEELIRADNVFGNGSCQELDNPTRIAKKEIQEGLTRLSERMEGYEVRPQQQEMSFLTGEAFNRNQFLVVEAGTGTGKSIGYLIPAILNAIRRGERVVISTNTKNLQEQLFYQDIPTLHRYLDKNFKAVLLKGRNNYICRRRWYEVLQNLDVELIPDERQHLLPLVVWAQETTSGDVTECNGFKVYQHPSLWTKINADTSNCSSRECPHFHNGSCFLYNIRRQASDAHLVVVNHSLLFSDLQSENSALDQYSRLIIDEAHNLERVATDFLGNSLSVWTLKAISQRLYTKTARGETGQLVKLRQAVAMSRSDLNWKGMMQSLIFQTVTDSHKLWEESMAYFQNLTDFIRGLESAKVYKGARKIRLLSNHPFFSKFKDPTDDLKIHLESLKQHLDRLKEGLEDEDSSRIDHYETLRQETAGRIGDIQGLIDTLDFFFKPDEELHVYWLEGARKSDSFDSCLRSAPLEVGPILKEKLYDNLKSIVFTSATIAVNQSFKFFNERVGLELVSVESLTEKDRVVSKQVGSPFDYEHQSLILAPSYLPEPKSQSYTEHVGELLKSMTFFSRRGTLALFTSYGMLNKVYHNVKHDFESKRIMLLGQGQDGSRTSLLNRFKDEGGNAVLFGTDSFWEGVDIPGKSLEVLIITRLPFLVPDEPLTEAYQEALAKKGLNPFEKYMIPKAVLKFRQGFGRLIRRQDDIGLVIITDIRATRSRYGSIFMNSLPTKYYQIRSESEMLRSAKRFFDYHSSRDKEQ